MFSSRKANYAAETATLEIGADEHPARVVAPCPPKQGQAQAVKRVLLLDDREDFRDVLQDYLASFAFHVTAVGNGAEGLREFLKDPFDLILCDMMMPKLNGEMFYWAVTRMRPAAGQRFIFITGHQSQPTIQSFFERIKAAVLIKPFKLDDLRTIMQRVLTQLR
jgi:CheY-like chemotaxis protein